jgi:polysaccharide export outer membrane protein
VSPVPAPVQTINVSPTPYVIGVGDVLTIAVWRHADVSAEVVVRPDGKISVPLVNEIEAAGMTPERLRQTITAALGRYLENPSVTVQIKEIHSRKVFVVGQVGRPGAYSLNQSMTVLQLLAEAGGLTPFANRNAIVIVRDVAGTSVNISFDYAAVATGQQLEQNIVLMPGDTVVVR